MTSSGPLHVYCLVGSGRDDTPRREDAWVS